MSAKNKTTQAVPTTSKEDNLPPPRTVIAHTDRKYYEIVVPNTHCCRLGGIEVEHFDYFLQEHGLFGKKRNSQNNKVETSLYVYYKNLPPEVIDVDSFIDLYARFIWKILRAYVTPFPRPKYLPV